MWDTLSSPILCSCDQTFGDADQGVFVELGKNLTSLTASLILKFWMAGLDAAGGGSNTSLFHGKGAEELVLDESGGMVWIGDVDEIDTILHSLNYSRWIGWCIGVPGSTELNEFSQIALGTGLGKVWTSYELRKIHMLYMMSGVEHVCPCSVLYCTALESLLSFLWQSKPYPPEDWNESPRNICSRTLWPTSSSDALDTHNNEVKMCMDCK